MKKLVEAIVFASLVLCGCEMKSVNPDLEPIKQITWKEAVGLKEFVLISKKEDCPYPYYTTLRTVYIKKGEQIYYISSRPSIPEEIWNDYFKNSQKGDTIRF